MLLLNWILDEIKVYNVDGEPLCITWKLFPEQAECRTFLLQKHSYLNHSVLSSLLSPSPSLQIVDLPEPQSP